MYKRALLYIWYYDKAEQEIDLYDKMGLCYYYLYNIQYAMYYHYKSVNSTAEPPNSNDRKMAIESITEFNRLMASQFEKH